MPTNKKKKKIKFYFNINVWNFDIVLKNFLPILLSGNITIPSKLICLFFVFAYTVRSLMKFYKCMAQPTQSISLLI